MALPLTPDARWLFIGDSITDCGRLECPEGIGSGYVRIVRDWLRASAPASAPAILNRGISGNKIGDLEQRWQSDVIAHQPALVSIKIGINDVWHGLPGGSGGTAIEDFRKTYSRLLQQLKAALPGTVIVLCEPSVIWAPAPEEGDELLRPYVEVVQAAATAAGAETVPLRRAFATARCERPEIPWVPDGVHPGSSGHMLIARTWLATLGLL